jgi:hypothetical protein
MASATFSRAFGRPFEGSGRFLHASETFSVTWDRFFLASATQSLALETFYLVGETFSQAAET